jgi:hypothetical protein
MESFLFSGIISGIYIVLYKLLFIDYFNEDYVKQSLEIGLYPTSKLLLELFQGFVPLSTHLFICLIREAE